VREHAARRALRFCLSSALALSGCTAQGGAAPWGDLLQAAGVLGVAPLDDATIVSGLKEALRVGTRNAVASTSRMDGFLADELIRIALPEQLETMGNALRRVGLGGQFDQLQLTMNRAAEHAAGEATDVFIDAVRQMTFEDARNILQGNETAATDHFRSTTSDSLRARFSPIVNQKMREVGLARLYQDLVGRYTALPFASKPELDLGSYVTEKTLDGLFTVLAQEESKIRSDPAARITPLLQRVFGSQ
jgi:hypothetical protein